MVVADAASLTMIRVERVARGPDYKIIMMVNSPDGGKGSRIASELWSSFSQFLEHWIYLNMYALF
ncbi:hypothetical protein MTR_8g028010 [Medicago truncatula]|uniref:Uncharacterized protein n=1 Tax=Medicago truncatula TaxID=3880 RepID=A0A072TYU0_MEDTR|nr:hypothetical protein MTR_8g028010 [Medicago truncatula]